MQQPHKYLGQATCSSGNSHTETVGLDNGKVCSKLLRNIKSHLIYSSKSFYSYLPRLLPYGHGIIRTKHRPGIEILNSVRKINLEKIKINQPLITFQPSSLNPIFTQCQITPNMVIHTTCSHNCHLDKLINVENLGNLPGSFFSGG